MAPNDPKQPRTPAAAAAGAGRPVTPPEEPKAPGSGENKAPTDAKSLLAQKLIKFMAGNPTNEELETFIAGELRALGIADGNTQALVEIYKQYAKLHADYAGKLSEIIATSTGRNLDEKNKLINDALKDLREAWMKQYLDIIKRGIEGKISPHETKIEMAKMGIMFGSLLQGIGHLFGKPELVAMGKDFVDRNTKDAEMEGQIILDMKKEADRIKQSAPDKWYERLEREVRTSFEAELQRNVLRGRVALDPAQAADIARRVREAETGRADPYSILDIAPLNDFVRQQGRSLPEGYSTYTSNNLLNLRVLGSETEFRTFASVGEGWQAAREDLLAKISGQSPAMAGRYGKGYRATLENVITTWAPPSQNKTNEYLEYVSRATGISRDTVLTAKDLDKIMPAMAWREGTARGVKMLQTAGIITKEQAIHLARVQADIALEAQEAKADSKLGRRADAGSAIPADVKVSALGVIGSAQASAAGVTGSGAFGTSNEGELNPVFSTFAQLMSGLRGTTGDIVGHRQRAGDLSMDGNAPGSFGDGVKGQTATVAGVDPRLLPKPEPSFNG